MDERKKKLKMLKEKKGETKNRLKNKEKCIFWVLNFV